MMGETGAGEEEMMLGVMKFPRERGRELRDGGEEEDGMGMEEGT